jgi:hypothetical protein
MGILGYELNISTGIHDLNDRINCFRNDLINSFRDHEPIKALIMKDSKLYELIKILANNCCGLIDRNAWNKYASKHSAEAAQKAIEACLNVVEKCNT